MNEMRKTTLIEELAITVANDIHNNNDTRIKIISAEDSTIYYPSHFTAREIILILNRSMLEYIVTDTIDSSIEKTIVVTKKKDKNMLLRTLLNIIVDYEDQEIPETVVLTVDGKPVMEDWGGNILKNIPESILNRPIKFFGSGCMVMDGSCFEIHV